MDGISKTTLFWGCRVTKMPYLEEKIKFKKKKPTSKQCRFFPRSKPGPLLQFFPFFPSQPNPPSSAKNNESHAQILLHDITHKREAWKGTQRRRYFTKKWVATHLQLCQTGEFSQCGRYVSREIIFWEAPTVKGIFQVHLAMHL